MNRKAIIMELRGNRLLKGRKPAVVFLKINGGQIYKGSQSDFVLTISDKYITFQKLSAFLKKLEPKKDFKIERSMIKSYNLRDINVATKCLTLYTVERKYVEIYYNVGLRDNIESQDNIKRIIDELVLSGVKESRI